MDGSPDSRTATHSMTSAEEKTVSATRNADTSMAETTMADIPMVVLPASEKRGGDAAAKLLGNNRPLYSTADNKRVLRKIDMVILPLMLIVYFLQSLDKATISYAAVFGLSQDADLHGEQFSWLTSIVYIAQLVMQPLLAGLLVLLPVGKFSAVMVFLWGATLACMAAAHDFSSLMAGRFFLGAFEASIAPAFIAITQMWWRRREQTVRFSCWYSMNGLAGMLGSLMTWGLGHVHSSSLKAYQIIFLVFGIITIAFSFVVGVFMPDSPMEAKFLSHADKLIAVERLRMNQMGVMSREWRWDHVREAATDVKSWLWFTMIFFISIPSGGFGTFGPLIVKSFGYDKFQTVLFNIPFGAVAFVAILGGAFAAMKLKMKGPVLAGLCVPPIIGCAILLHVPHDASNKALLLFGYYIASVFPGITPLIFGWSAQNTAGDTKRKCVNALVFVGASVGNIIGPQLYTQDEAPGYSRGLRSNLALYVVILLLIGATSAWLAVCNARHAKRRVAMGKSAVVHDVSLDTVEENERRLAESVGEARPVKSAGDRAFDDLTDLQNEDFLYVY